MKKTFKILSIILLSIIVLMMVLPLLFKGKIEAVAKQEINKQVNANVNWQDLSVSLFKNFPDLSVSLVDLSIVGINQFEKDTLFGINDLTISVDLLSAISGSNIEINKIELIKPSVNAKVLADSTMNWDIFEYEESSVEESQESDSVSDFKIQLNDFIIEDGAISYVDETMNLIYKMSGFNLSLNGDFSASETLLDLNSNIAHVFLSMDNSTYLQKIGIDLKAKIQADLDKMIFTFEENHLLINTLALSFNGKIGIIDRGYDLDLSLNTTDSEFSSVLNLIPEDFTEYTKGIETTGNFNLGAMVKGKYEGTDSIPSFNLGLLIKNGSVKYTDLPETVEKINIDLKIDNNGGSIDNTVVNLSTCHCEVADNKIDAKLKISNPISNLSFQGSLLGDIDFSKLSNAIPTDSITLAGLLKTDLKFKGDQASIVEENYDKINMDGNFLLKDFLFTSLDTAILNLSIKVADVKLDTKTITLDDFKSTYGQSDFSLKGSISDYLVYSLGDGTIRGSLAHHSDFINVNEFLPSDYSDEETEETASADTTLFIVPDNIDFEFISSVNKFKYDKLDVDNINGKITVKNGIVKLNNMAMNLLNGQMAMSGQYNTQNAKKPFVDFAFKANSIDINKTANSFSVVDSLLPIAKKSKGDISSTLNYYSVLDNQMQPIINSITGGGNLVSNYIEVSNSKVLDKMANLLKQDKYRTLKAEDLDVKFKLEDGKIKVEPFTTKVFDKEIHVQGEQGFDQTLNYHIKAPVTGGDVATALGFNAGSGGSQKDYMVKVIIKGTASDPILTLDSSEAKKEIEKDVKKEAEKAIKEVLKDKNVKKKINEFLKGL